MLNLINFYKTKEWVNLLRVIKIERTDGNGEIICEHCGRPIYKAYDCIGHHKIPLTEENINDYSISLNPDNIALVHHRCHNNIHNKLGYAGRKVYLVYGSPLSGKTTYVKENMLEGDLVVDMDRIWRCLSGCELYVKPNRLKSNVFAVRDLLLEDIGHRFGKWSNAYVIGGYPLQGERERLVKRLGAEEIFINTDKEECLRRLQEDNKRNTEEWEKYIMEWWERYTPHQRQ